MPKKFETEMENAHRAPQYFVDQVEVDTEDKTCRIRGWAVFCRPLDIYLEDRRHNRIPCELQRVYRMDVKKQFPDIAVPDDCGFFFKLPYKNQQIFYLVFQSDGVVRRHLLCISPAVRFAQKLGRYVQRTQKYLRQHGAKALCTKVSGEIKYKLKGVPDYHNWLPKHLPTSEVLEQQRQTRFAWEPKISVVIPLYKTPEKYLRALVKSLQNQTYGNWELCLSDGSGAQSPIAQLLEDLMKEESRIRVVSHEIPLQISENTNAAIEIATGDFIAFADHDDELTAHALFECVKALNENPDLEVIYSDEDKMTMDGKKFFQPHFKPDFNMDLLCSQNYICHLFVAKRELLDKVGLLRKEFDGSQDYDFILRCVEAVTADKIYHIPKILYHWRCHEDSTAENPESKLYAFDAGTRAVQAHYDRMEIPANVTKGEYLGIYRTKFLWDTKPLISILIPNKDHVEDLQRCIESIEEKSSYKNYEIIIIENNSTEKETFSYYKQLETSNANVRVVYWKGIFNYSAINNFGAQFANGEYLLLLNNDTQILNEDCIEEMLGYCMREDVGAVGARLYYEDNTIQHAGVIVGMGGIAGHCFVQKSRGFSGYFHRIICAQNYSAVTAACMLVKKSAFEAVKGLDEDLAVAFNDIDFCLRLRQAGYLLVYNPYAELYHYESKSRGLDDTPEKMARFQKETMLFEKRWGKILEKGDPYYNPNLTLEVQDFSLKRL